jgi:hypothetical protein
MLQQLNAAYDRNTINLLLMLAHLEESGWKRFEVTGDGFLAFSPLLASELINVTERAPVTSSAKPQRICQKATFRRSARSL